MQNSKARACKIFIEINVNQDGYMSQHRNEGLIWHAFLWQLFLAKEMLT